MGVPGPYNWRGSLFKNAMFTGTLGDFTYDMDWYQSAVEDQTLFNSVPRPVTSYYSYLGKAVLGFVSMWMIAVGLSAQGQGLELQG